MTCAAGASSLEIIAWLVLGLISGFIGSKIVNGRGEGFFGDIIVGVVGALLGGFLFSHFGGTGITGLNLWSILVAVAGSVLLLVVFHAVRRGR